MTANTTLAATRPLGTSPPWNIASLLDGEGLVHAHDATCVWGALSCILIAVFIGACTTTFGQGTVSPSASPPLGSPGCYPTPEQPIGWRGDWTGRFPGATPPTQWSRRAKGITSEIKYQAQKPSDAPGTDSHPLE